MKGLVSRCGDLFELMDYIGHDVNYVVTERSSQPLLRDLEIQNHWPQKRFIEAGWLAVQL
jgi:3-hydroxybutyryl-CoA dehydrogenase